MTSMTSFEVKALQAAVEHMDAHLAWYRPDEEVTVENVCFALRDVNRVEVDFELSDGTQMTFDVSRGERGLTVTEKEVCNG